MKSLNKRLNKLLDKIKPILRTVITLGNTSNAARNVMIVPETVTLDEWEQQSIKRHDKYNE